MEQKLGSEKNKHFMILFYLENVYVYLFTWRMRVVKPLEVLKVGITILIRKMLIFSFSHLLAKYYLAQVYIILVILGNLALP